MALTSAIEGTYSSISISISAGVPAASLPIVNVNAPGRVVKLAFWKNKSGLVRFSLSIINGAN